MREADELSVANRYQAMGLDFLIEQPRKGCIR
jgi:hypothetical protein